MNLRNFHLYLPAACLCLLLFTGANTFHSAPMQLQFTHVVNGKPMALQTGIYTNAVGDSFNITMFKYYVSNFSLTSSNGQEVSLPPAYFLVNESDTASKTITLPTIPEGIYSSISFLIGVDSIRNMSGAQTGALDPVNGMFWTWNSGYIMAKLEGLSPVSKQPNKLIEFHIGGFQGTRNTLRRVTLTFAKPFALPQAEPVVMPIVADAYTWFSQPNTVSFQHVSSCTTPGAQAMRIADNYQHMFSIKRD